MTPAQYEKALGDAVEFIGLTVSFVFMMGILACMLYGFVRLIAWIIGL